MSLPCAVIQDLNRYARELELAASNAELLESIEDELVAALVAVKDKNISLCDTLKKVKAAVAEINTTIQILEGM